MPQRFLRPGITTSQHFNLLSYHAQTFYVRLITLVDDFGRYDAEPRLLRSHAFPFGDPAGHEIPLKTLENMCEQLSVNALAIFYIAADGKKYVQLVRWQERARADKSKFPQYDNTCEQMFANASKCSPPSSSSSPSSSSPSFGPNGQAAPAALSVGIEEIWKAYPRRVKKPAAVRAIQKALKKVSPEFLLARTLAYAETQPDNDRFTPHPATWFNAEQYLDDPSTWMPNDSQQKKPTGDIQWTD